MKSGDKVCILIEGKWKRGKVVKDKKEKITVSIKDKNHPFDVDFDRKNVKRLVCLDKEEAKITHTKQFYDLCGLITELKHKFFPEKKIEIDDLNITIENFDIGPCIMEVETIGAIKEVAGWNVSTTVYSDLVDGFPDVDVVDLGNHRDFTNAVLCLLKNLFEAEVKLYLDKKREDFLAKMMLNDEMF